MAQPRKKLRYNDSYVQFGFTVINSGGEEKPQCVLCYRVLASSALKPSKLKRHLVTHHPDFQNKDADFFKRKADSLVRSRLDNTGDQWKENAAGLTASYEVARKIATAKKPHTIGEQLILPCCQIIVSNVFGESEVQKLKQVSLSNDTVSRRISELSENILSHVVSKIQKSMFGFFAIQLDETTDVANLAELCVFVRYIHEGHLEDEFLFCSPLTTRTTAKDIFNFVNKFFDKHNLKWKHAIGVCTDGAPAMLGCRSGFQTLVKEQSPDVVGTHCTIHRQALMAKTLPDQLKNVLDDVVKAVNFIKANALNSRLFAELCKENDSEFVTVLLHSRVRWLSKGKVLKRAFILRQEMKNFLQGPKPELHQKFSDNCFLMCLSFLVDIFESVNFVNLALQGKETNLIHCQEKLSAFSMKLTLWHSKLQNKNFAPFPHLNAFLDENELNVNEGILEVMACHISILREEIRHYFPDLEDFERYCRFVSDPFGTSVGDLPSQDILLQEQFIDLVNDGNARRLFSEKSCSDFWIEMAQSYPDISKMALKVLIPFPTTYECESAFSALLAIKPKARNRLDAIHDMRVALSTTEPNIAELVTKKQLHPSH